VGGLDYFQLVTRGAANAFSPRPMGHHDMGLSTPGRPHLPHLVGLPPSLLTASERHSVAVTESPYAPRGLSCGCQRRRLPRRLARLMGLSHSVDALPSAPGPSANAVICRTLYPRLLLARLMAQSWTCPTLLSVDALALCTSWSFVGLPMPSSAVPRRAANGFAARAPHGPVRLCRRAALS